MKRLALIIILCFSGLSFHAQRESNENSKPKLRKLKNYKHWAKEKDTTQTQEKPTETIKPYEKPKLRTLRGKKRGKRPSQKKDSNGEKYRQLRKRKKKMQ